MFTFRERGEGISRRHLQADARHFLAHYVRRYDKSLTGVAEDAWHAMRRHRWPGNVRELAHSVERAVLLAPPQATTIAARDLGLQMAAAGASATDLSLEEAERLFIEKALARHSGDVRAASQQLGLSRSALYRRLQQYGIRS